MEKDREDCDDNAVSGIGGKDNAIALAILSHLLGANATRKLAKRYCSEVLNPETDAAPREDYSKQ